MLDTEDASSGFWRVLSDVVKDKYLRRALLVGCLLQATQQLTGINTVMYYSATIIQMSGVGDKTQAVWMASVTALVNFLTTFIGVYVVDKTGRRSLTLFSLAGVICSLLLLAAGFKIEAMYSPRIGSTSLNPVDSECALLSTCNACTESASCGFCYPKGVLTNGSCLAVDPDSPFSFSSTGICSSNVSSFSDYTWSAEVCPADYSFIVLAGLCLYLLTFGPGMGPMPWTINSEIYPLWARTTCVSITTSMSWLFNMLISLTFLTLVRILTKEGSFTLYALFGLIGFILLYIYLPETKGKNLEDTYAMFRSKESKRKNGFDKKLKSSPNPKINLVSDQKSTKSSIISRTKGSNTDNSESDMKVRKKSLIGYDNLQYDPKE
jgi:SP family myo-inositol transporter-like MFS transporter 13